MAKLLAFALGISVMNFAADLPSREISTILLLASLVAHVAMSLLLHRCAAVVEPLRARLFGRVLRINPCTVIPPLLIASSFLLGLSWHMNWGQRQLSRLLSPALEQRNLLVIGKISSIPQVFENYEQFEFVIEESGQALLPRKVLLNNYGEAIARAGERWQLTLRLRRPHGLANPGGFDYEAFLLQRGIGARGTVVSAASNTPLPNAGTAVPLRFSLHSRLTERVEGLAHGGILLALTLGDRAAIDPGDWALFGISGTTHLLVISGLHVGFAAGLGYRLMLLLSRTSLLPAGLLLRWPAQLLASLAAIATAASYSALAGFSLPTQRALVMVIVLTAATLLRRRAAPLGTLLLALCACLLLNPMAPLSAGLWLSFLAVAALLLMANSVARAALPLQGQSAKEGNGLVVRMREWGGQLRQWLLLALRAQFTVFLALCLPMLFWLGEVSIVSPLANFVAIPLVGLIAVPLCLASLALIGPWPEAAGLLLALANSVLSLLIAYLESIRSLTAVLGIEGFEGAIRFAAPGLSALFFLACFFLLMLLPMGIPVKRLAFLLLLPVVFPRKPEFSSDLDIHILDVGQGLAVIVRSEDRFLLYDSGPAIAGGMDSGTEVVLPLLRRLGARELDALVISHGDNDHAGGAAGLLQGMPARSVYASESRLLSAYEMFGSEFCAAGSGWAWGRSHFDFLHPAEFGASGNNNSCVLRIRHEGQALLLPGDIEASTELALAAQHGGELQAALLLSPHHGSNTSSTFAFLKNINPYYSVTSSGYLNRFGHPSPQVLTRLETLGISHLNTASSGMISFSIGESGLSPPRRYRDYAKRYWYQ